VAQHFFNDRLATVKFISNYVLPLLLALAFAPAGLNAVPAWDAVNVAYDSVVIFQIMRVVETAFLHLTSSIAR